MNTGRKRKVCVVVASRANYGRIKSVMKAITEHPDLELQVVVGASALLYRFGQVIDVVKKDGFNVDAIVYYIVEGENLTTMAKSTGLAIIELATLFENLKPDVVLSVADRFETMATAIASSYMNVPLAHTQGGEITGSIDENVRHAITKLAHIHFPATELSAERLIRMGENPQTVHVTGCPSLDIILDSDMPPVENLNSYGGVGSPINFLEPYLVVLQHPVTTEYGSGFEQVNETLKAVKELNMQTVWLWPNVDAGSDDISKGIRMFRERNRDFPVHFYRNFKVEDFLVLIKNCVCMMGNSSSAIREGAFLGVPAVNIGTRQLGRERCENVIDVNYNHSEIFNAVQKHLSHGPYPPNHLYGNGKAGPEIADILSKAAFNIHKRFYEYKA